MTSETAAQESMAPRYAPDEVERRLYGWWEESGNFQPQLHSQSPSFVITIPPPNVTGDLHLGHALTYGLEDLLGRFKRMQGFNTLILPGTDHAGIATQNVVEKQLARDGISRHDIGREAFVARVWEWKEQYADNIRRQFKAMGCGFDWSRERFTMDPGYVDAVLEFFIRLYAEGKIYRGWRVINWCVRCHSAISDIEVETVEREDALYFLRYPLTEGGGEIVVATVRPETILGDVAVAVHPEDERYASFIGSKVRLPLLGRELEIIGDSMVSREFGTGAVKITPAHDFEDFEVAQRHGLSMPIAIDQEARITTVGERYAGLSVQDARVRILADLEAGGNLLKSEPYRHQVPTCERCGTLLEPLLSEQWFMHMRELAEPAIEAVTDGRTRFVPERWERVYLDWMANIRPWTLSRQLWWGHRIPIYYCAAGHATAAKEWPQACDECGEQIERQDPDVLDTWFSSALWPFATLGWPAGSRDLESFYPTSFMNTSSQILYLWIARMIMTGLKFQGPSPFPVVLINPTILNKDGQRMSKSLGTGIDPLELVSEYGADALRFGLMTSGSTHQQEIRFSTDKVEQSRNFANKVWNIARFVVGNQNSVVGELNLTLPDFWILSRTNQVISAVTADLENYEFSGAGHKLQDFLWNEVADWYVEIAKIRLFDDDDLVGQITARAVLWSVLDRAIRLLHPYMPFLTEEIWQHLRQCGSDRARELSGWTSPLATSIMAASWPTLLDFDDKSEREMDLVMRIVRAVRTVRAEYHVDPGRFVSATIQTRSSHEFIHTSSDLISKLARVKPLTIKENVPREPENSSTLIVGNMTVFIPLSELTDVEAERQRLQRELGETERAVRAVASKLGNANFVDRAPSHIVAQERDRADTLQQKQKQLEERLALLRV